MIEVMESYPNVHTKINALKTLASFKIDLIMPKDFREGKLNCYGSILPHQIETNQQCVSHLCFGDATISVVNVNKASQE